ncbi:MAG: hypothetical protein A4E67_02400 [Syntrophaceae bacterium PtaB.Bin038]|nr:MAG: hypothetical protein A4E67_02400 [Syntrophaceae bacterium PtaB.Bin038]
MRRLIVNADDLGADEARNEGIFEAIRAGVVTSASILPNGPALGHALEKIRSGGCEGVSFGAHLNLSEGRPLAAGLSRLSGPDGSFLGKAGAHRLLAGAADASLTGEIAKETALQIVRLLDAGIALTHVDGHQHVHIFPAALLAVAETAKGLGISRMRIPEEPFPPGDDAPADGMKEARMFSALGREARGRLASSGIASSDHFRGLALKGRLDLERLVELVGALPEGTTELMVHPGRVPAGGAFSAFSSADRERELEALLHPRFRQALTAAGVELASFREIGS